MEQALISGSDATREYASLPEQPHRRRWYRDPGVAEMIEYLEPYRNEPGKLTSQHVAQMNREIARCKDSFEYAARNYFWISTKQGEEILFKLLDTQELILESLYELLAKRGQARLLILKSRQLGCSTLIQALMVWRVVFFRLQNAVTVSHDPKHAGQMLFNRYFLYILDRLPWWMRPMEVSREIFDGIYFANPDSKTKNELPGNESRVWVFGANKRTGVGQGIPVSTAHVSELADYAWDKALDIMEGDLSEALTPNAIAIAESTGKCAGSYFHNLWRKSVEMGEDALWQPRFFPSFFDKAHFLPPPQGWVVAAEENRIKDLVQSQWVQCDDSQCGQMRESIYGGRSLVETECPVCNFGTLLPKELENGQLRWYEIRRLNAGDNEKSVKTFLEEQCVTAEDAFQVPGESAFPLSCLMYASSTVRSPAPLRGFFDQQGTFHANNPKTGECIHSWCGRMHRYDECIVNVWELPQAGCDYVIGADVGAGLGSRNDYSVGVVWRLGGSKDYQVATLRSNTLQPEAFARPLKDMGIWYNTALLAVEANKHDACAVAVLDKYEYPNVYESERPGSLGGKRRYHWFTTPKTKPNIFTNYVMWLKAETVEVRSDNLVEEMKVFVRDEGTRQGVSAIKGAHDDEVMAGQIGLWCGHVGDFDELTNRINLPEEPKSIEESEWAMVCTKCSHKWGADRPDEYDKCPVCSSIMLKGVATYSTTTVSLDFEKEVEYYSEVDAGRGFGESLDSL